jgi:hypothetical protein
MTAQDVGRACPQIPESSMPHHRTVTRTDPNTGVAIVSGTITCPAPATVTIGATLRQSQKVGKVNTTVEASAETAVVCGGTRPWSVALAPATGGFKNGTGTVTARTTAGPAYLRTAEASRAVKLVWGRK